MCINPWFCIYENAPIAKRNISVYPQLSHYQICFAWKHAELGRGQFCRDNVTFLSAGMGTAFFSSSERIVLLRSFKAHNILLRSFFKFLVTYETQKNDAFFCVP